MKRITVSDLRAIESLQKNTEKFIDEQIADFVTISDQFIIIYTNTGLLKMFALSNGHLVYEKNVTLNQIKTIVKIRELIAIACKGSNQLVICDINLDKLEYLDVHLGALTDLRIFENSIASSSKDMTIRLWEVSNSKDINKRPVKFPIAFHGHKGPVNAISVFGKFLISSSEDKSVICWTNKGLWASISFGETVIKILPCPLSSQVIVFTSNNNARFIGIDSIVKKKIQVKGVLSLTSLQYPQNVCQLDQSFALVTGKKSLQFLQVNLMKKIHEINLEEQNKITEVKCKGRCIFLGEKDYGIKVIKI